MRAALLGKVAAVYVVGKVRLRPAARIDSLPLPTRKERVSSSEGLFRSGDGLGFVKGSTGSSVGGDCAGLLFHQCPSMSSMSANVQRFVWTGPGRRSGKTVAPQTGQSYSDSDRAADAHRGFFIAPVSTPPPLCGMVAPAKTGDLLKLLAREAVAETGAPFGLIFRRADPGRAVGRWTVGHASCTRQLLLSVLWPRRRQTTLRAQERARERLLRETRV
jgi:phage protein U